MIIYGNSLKITDALRNCEKIKNIEIVSWRGSNIINNNEDIRKNTLIICGFNHEAYCSGFKFFIDNNIYKPVNRLKNIIDKFEEVIYLDTSNSKSLKTSSYYVYAKSEFKRILIKKRPDLKIVELPFVVNSNGWPDFYANFFERLIAYIVIRYKKLPIVFSNDIAEYVFLNMRSVTSYDVIKKDLINRRTPRNRFLDKVFRVLYG